MKNNFSGPVILALVIGLIVGFALGVWWQNSVDKSPEVEENVVTFEQNEVSDEFGGSTTLVDNVPSVATQAGTGMIVVEDQAAGASVLVSKVIAGQGSWLAVREDMDGALGNILGATYIEAGDYGDVTVPLRRGTESGNTYYVVLFGDNGDDIFNYTVDGMVQVDGELVLGSMTTN